MRKILAVALFAALSSILPTPSNEARAADSEEIGGISAKCFKYTVTIRQGGECTVCHCTQCDYYAGGWYVGTGDPNCTCYDCIGEVQYQLPASGFGLPGAALLARVSNDLRQLECASGR